MEPNEALKFVVWIEKGYKYLKINYQDNGRSHTENIVFDGGKFYLEQEERTPSGGQDDLQQTDLTHEELMDFFRNRDYAAELGHLHKRNEH